MRLLPRLSRQHLWSRRLNCGDHQNPRNSSPASLNCGHISCLCCLPGDKLRPDNDLQRGGVFLLQCLKKQFTSRFRDLNGEAEYVIPDGVTKVGNYAFYKKDALSSLVLPSSLQDIGNYAFYWCPGITGAIAISSMHSIGDYAFFGCDGITSLKLETAGTKDPETGDIQAGSIGESAFSNCTNLTEMDFAGEAPSVQRTSFSNVGATLTYDSKSSGWFEFMNSMLNSSIVMLEKSECERAIALVVDASGNMNGAAMEALREAVSKFCETVVSEDGKTKVVIISYDDTPMPFGFTSNLELLQKRAELLTDGGMTNMSSALILADRYLSSINAQEKDLIMMTDGLPNEGSASYDGPFTSSDNSSYQYANAICNMCADYYGG